MEYFINIHFVFNTINTMQVIRIFVVDIFYLGEYISFKLNTNKYHYHEFNILTNL